MLSAAADKIRLNRFLARAGIASRRKSDDLIAAGAVRVNGEVVDRPGRVVDPRCDRVEVNGRRARLPESLQYVLLNKPAGLLVTRSDERGRATVFERTADLRPGVVAVGRLDRDTTGVLLLTDDGELAYRLTHPRYGIDKVYEAVVEGHPTGAALRCLRRGVELEDGMTSPADVQLLPGRDAQAVLQIRIHEGRKRQVKRMCEAVGHPVASLDRTEFAGLSCGRLRPGQSRELHAAEVGRLRVLAGLPR